MVLHRTVIVSKVKVFLKPLKIVIFTGRCSRVSKETWSSACQCRRQAAAAEGRVTKRWIKKLPKNYKDNFHNNERRYGLLFKNFTLGDLSLNITSTSLKNRPNDNTTFPNHVTLAAGDDDDNIGRYKNELDQCED